MKAERLPKRAVRRLSDEQRRAYDRLRWAELGPADRARCKLVLGWRRTREETVALAAELLAEGLVGAAVASKLNVSPRYLRQVLADTSETSVLSTLDPSVQAVEMRLTGESGRLAFGAVPRHHSVPQPRAFACFAELDAYLDEQRVPR